MYAYHILRSQPIRFALTISGIALCVMLMLFLLGIYRGVADGSVEYVRRNHADLWVLQRNATNILRGSSLLSTGHGAVLRQIEGVRSCAPVLLILSAIRRNEQPATIFLTGFDPQLGVGGPPTIVEGRNVVGDNEIVLDKSFAARFGHGVGQTLIIQDDSLLIVGLSGGTNAFVIQYAFSTLRRVQSLLGFPGVVTCFLVAVSDSTSARDVAGRIRDELPGLEVFDHETFLANNVHEMESGVLPLLSTVAIIGAIVLTTILSLLLSVNIVERRQDFAVMKTLGSPPFFLGRLVMDMALVIATTGTVAGVAAFFPMTIIIEWLRPEISTASSVWHIFIVLVASAIVSVLSAGIAARKLRHIYPLEAFQ